ncbi:MAG: DUF445 domain-containing protein [Bacteroidota bacterium]
MNYLLVLIPIISGFIGWITNWIAIKMLFHPKQPVVILGIQIQGIFPKRQQQFAAKLGKLVGEELLSFDEIKSIIANPNNLSSIMPMLDQAIDRFLKEKLSATLPMISMFIGDKTIDKIKTVLSDELEQMLPLVIDQYVNTIKDRLDLEKIVTDKVRKFSSDKLESILYQVMAKEFKSIELLGGILGFLIGLLQVALTYLAN